jgi:hypothetical protein
MNTLNSRTTIINSIERRRRRGFTLFESLVCISAGFVIFTITFQLLRAALEIDGGNGARGAGFSASAQSLDRLVQQFRDDAHAAVGASPAVADGATAKWTFQFPDERRVEYLASDRAITRTEYHADQVKTRDAFWLPSDTMLHWLLTTAENHPASATLSLEQAKDDREPQAKRSLKIEATLSRDQAVAVVQKKKS